jgi:hypothetical protein
MALLSLKMAAILWSQQGTPMPKYQNLYSIHSLIILAHLERDNTGITLIVAILLVILLLFEFLDPAINDIKQSPCLTVFIPCFFL